MTGKHNGQGAAWRNMDCGLGYCYSCVAEAWHAEHAAPKVDGGGPARVAPRPRWAVTTAPSPKPIPAPDGGIGGLMLVTLPTCYEHLAFKPVASQGPADRRPAVAPGRRWNRGDLLS